MCEVDLMTTLERTLIQTLMDAAFVCADPVPLLHANWGKSDPLKALISLPAPIKGELSLIASPELCRELASNMLGVDTDDKNADRLARDALKELLNMAAGLLSANCAQGEALEAPESLGVPRIEQMRAGTVEPNGTVPAVALLTDQGQYLVAVFCEEKI
jgi:CheY-specific phosphatase CheX